MDELRIKATKIRLTHPHGNDGRPLQIDLTRFTHDDLWQAADDLLVDWAQHAPHVDYVPVHFTVFYQDTRKYRGIYQLTHTRNETPDLAHHIAESVEYKSAQHRPSWAPESLYCWYIEVTPQQAHQYAEFYDHYEIGHEFEECAA